MLRHSPRPGVLGMVSALVLLLWLATHEIVSIATIKVTGSNQVYATSGRFHL